MPRPPPVGQLWAAARRHAAARQGARRLLLHAAHKAPGHAWVVEARLSAVCRVWVGSLSECSFAECPVFPLSAPLPGFSLFDDRRRRDDAPQRRGLDYYFEASGSRVFPLALALSAVWWLPCPVPPGRGRDRGRAVLSAICCCIIWSARIQGPGSHLDLRGSVQREREICMWRVARPTPRHVTGQRAS